VDVKYITNYFYNFHFKKNKKQYRLFHKFYVVFINGKKPVLKPNSKKNYLDKVKIIL
jgi:hypothetical protein